MTQLVGLDHEEAAAGGEADRFEMMPLAETRTPPLSPPAGPPPASRGGGGPALLRAPLEGLARVVVEHQWAHAGLWHVEFGTLSTPMMLLEKYVVALNVGGPVQEEIWIDGQPWMGRINRPRAVSLMPAGVPHAMRSTGRGERVLVGIAPEFVASVRPSTEARALGYLPPAEIPAARNLVLALLELARAPSLDDALAADCALVALIHAIAGHDGREPPIRGVSLTGPKLRRVMEFISANLDRPLSLETLSRIVGMDVYRFARAFKQSTGTSPHRYLLQLRVARAKELLRDGDRPIADVALRTGFATQSHFSVTFRRITGMTPRSYRDGLA